MSIYLNFATGFNLPPFWLNRPVTVMGKEDTSSLETSADYLGNLYQDSIRMRVAGGEWWTLPLDPVVSVSGKNIIIRRNVLKKSTQDKGARGSIKEIWSQDDYEVNIAGVLIGKGELPESDLRKLREFCEARKVIEVESRLLSIFNISRLAIEDYSLPFTKGVENQMYAIKAYSDDEFQLFEKEEK
jgi:hypothetical protein